MIAKAYKWLYAITSRRDESGEVFGGCIQGAVRDAALEMCKPLNGRILEIGSGSGLFLMKLALQNPGSEIIGVDIIESLLDRTRSKIESKGIKNITLFVQNAMSMSFPDNHFDAAVCINFFLDMNIDDTIKILREMKRIVKSGGRIIFEYRNSHNLLFRLKYKFARYYDPSAPYPLYTYSPEQIDAIIKDLDLAVIRRTSLGFPIRKFAPIILIEAEKR